VYGYAVGGYGDAKVMVSGATFTELFPEEVSEWDARLAAMSPEDRAHEEYWANEP